MSEATITVGNFPKNTFFRHSREDLDTLFEQLDKPEENELQGIYRGYLFSIIGIKVLPVFLSSFFYWLFSTFINPWKGKRFDEDQGANYWFTNKGSCTFGEYDIVIPKEDGAETFLNYDVQRNLGILRPIRGQARRLSENVYLARMLYKTKKNTVTVLYFTLEKISADE